jgi:hypothetical protein
MIKKLTAEAKKVVLFSLLSTSTIWSFAANYYVSTSGNDNNNGSQGSPWKTISKAIASVGAGNTINLGSGTFTETNYIKLPSGVSLVGAGAANTKILVNKFYNLENFLNDCSGQGGKGWDPAIDQFAIQIAAGNNQTLKGFSMDGQARQNHGAIYMETGDKVIIEDLNIQNFKFTGVWLHNSSNCEIRNSYFKDNCFGTGGQDAGNIMFHANTNLLIHDNSILETGVMNGKGGYGIKSYAKWWTNACFWEQWDRGWNSISEGMKIYNNSIIVPSLGTWLAGGNAVPDITIEFNGITAKNCEIYNNYLTNHISLIGVRGNGYDFNSFHVHHNHFDLGQEYRYTMEADAQGIEFDHNFVNGGNYPIAQWGNNSVVNNLRVHHNVFQDIVGGGSWTPFFQLEKSEMKDMKFYNNTILDSKGIGNIFHVNQSSGSFPNADIRNNLFLATANRGNYFTNASITGTVSNNGFTNISNYGSNPLNGDMKLTNSGNQPNPYYTLQSASPAINAGVVITGYTEESVGNPDLGAYEYGVAAWKFGIVATAPTAVQSISLSPNSANVFIGESLALVVSVLPSDATNKSLTFQSSNPAVATVSANGVLNALSQGSTTITAISNDGNKTANATITVNKREGLYIEAETFNTMNGVLNKGSVVGSTDNGDWMKFNAIDFKTGYQKLTTNLAVDPAFAGGTVEFRLDAIDGKLLATLNPTNTGSWTDYQAQQVTITEAFSGVHDLYVLFKATQPNRGTGDFDWFWFTEPATITATNTQQMNDDNSVYPNPFTTHIQLSFEQSWHLYNSTGQLIKSEYSQTINSESLEAGLYMLQLNNGSIIKLIKND